jgi:predicted GNAT family N-acyltransferase
MIPCRAEILEFGSKAQIQSVGLRYEVLRKPLGLVFHPEDLNAESSETHFGLLRGELVVAVLLIKKVSDTEAKMRQVAVLPDEQGHGHGKQLVKFCEKWCTLNGFDFISLHARETAVPFYLSQGYSLVSERFEEVGIPHFKMMKQL